MGPPGAHKSLDQGVRHFQWAVLSANACTDVFAETLISVGMIERIGTFRGFEPSPLVLLGRSAELENTAWLQSSKSLYRIRRQDA